MKAINSPVPRRRSGIALALLAALALGAAPCRAEATAAPSERQALHILDRLGYGPRPDDLRRVMAMGVDRYIDEQLAPERISEPEDLTRRLAALDTLRMTPMQLFQLYGPPRAAAGVRPTPEERKARRQKARIILEQAVEARFLCAIESPRQLQEVMVEFWFNHFNVFARKGLVRLWTGAFEEEAIRPYALGRFRDLLGASARHPAMLFYLDNWQNTAPGSPGARGKERGLNENYAREVMELHTLGVDGGYTQRDVVALARIFTGWGLPRPRDRRLPGALAADDSGFYFDAERHDFGDKIFLGHTIRGRGLAEGEEALDMLARSPATARHIGFELAQYFVSDHPDKALVDALAQRFVATDGNIREVLRTLFRSAAFRDPRNFDAKYKTPYQYVISAVRLTGMKVVNVRPLWAATAQQGMPIYGYQTPEGYSNTRDAWLSPDAMTRRLSFATALGSGHLRIDRPPPSEPRETIPLAGRLGPALPPMADPLPPLSAPALVEALGGQLSPKTLDAVAAAPPALRASLVLGSPEFMQH